MKGMRGSGDGHDRENVPLAQPPWTTSIEDPQVDPQEWVEVGPYAGWEARPIWTPEPEIDRPLASGTAKIPQPLWDSENSDPNQQGRQSNVLAEAATLGFDVLAWYQTFRSGSIWGVYVREDAVVGLARELGRSGSQLGRVALLDAALNILFGHEYFHFLVDHGASVMERMTGNDLWLPWRESVGPFPPNYSFREEGLANAHAYRSWKTRGLAKATRDFLRRSPEGYRDWPQYLKEPAWTSGLRSVVSEIYSSGIVKADAGSIPLWGAEALIDEFQRTVAPVDVPLWVVRPPDEPQWLYFIDSLGDVTRSQGFSKELKRLPRSIQDRCDKALNRAADSVTGRNFGPLKGPGNRYKLRFGDYRVILARDGDQFVAQGVAHRKEVYG